MENLSTLFAFLYLYLPFNPTILGKRKRLEGRGDIDLFRLSFLGPGIVRISSSSANQKTANAAAG